MEKESVVNKYISVPRDKGSLNCAVYVAGIIEAVLTNSGFVSILNRLKYFQFYRKMHYFSFYI